MFKNLSVFQTAHAMAKHAGARQSLVAQNVANADTPGYMPRDLVEFSATPEKHRSFAATMRSTRAGHAIGQTSRTIAQLRPLTDENADPNKNGVSLEEEMVRSVEIQRDHERALTIYRSAMKILRTSVASR